MDQTVPKQITEEIAKALEEISKESPRLAKLVEILWKQGTITDANVITIAAQ
ncbi:MAG: hypothetical protein V2A74_09715 [bacterium]